MSRMDLFKDALASAVDRAARTFDETLESQLSEGRSRIATAAENLKSELPDSLLGDSAFEALAAPPAAPSHAILEAASRIDEAGDQGSVLIALLEGAQAFADRCLFILAKGDALEIWSGVNFENDDALVGKALSFDDAPWQGLRNASGVIHLDGDASRAIGSQLGVEPAERAVCVPFTLRQRLGGFVFADARGDGGIDVAALCLLTHIAALSLETLAVRGEGIAPALRNDADDEDALPVYAAAAAVAGAVAAVSSADEPDETEEIDGGEDASVTEEIEVNELMAPVTESTSEVAADVTEVEIDETSAGVGDNDTLVTDLMDTSLEDNVAATMAVPTIEDEPATTVKPPADEMFGEETVTEQIKVDASFPNIKPDSEVRTEVEREGDTLELEPIDPSLIPAPDQEHTDAAIRETVETGEFELDDPRFAKAAEPAEPAAVEAPQTPSPDDTANISEDQTVMSQRNAMYRPPEQQAESQVEPPSSDGDAARKGNEVVPPSDLSGPGSAFLAGGSDGDEALREEARRLARLLVSEIKLYNEDRLEEGRREGNIYNRLKEDVDRSRKMYHERIDPRLNDADRYFHQELVDRLAGGNGDLLGM